MSRRHDPRRAKAHRNYDSAEIAELFNVTIGTARKWRKEGMRPIDDRQPYIFSGSSVAEFLRHKNKPRQPLEPGQLFCLGCKAPREARDNCATLVRLGENNWGLRGKCAVSGHEVNRRVSLSSLQAAAGHLEVRHEDGTVALLGTPDTPCIDSSEGIVE